MVTTNSKFFDELAKLMGSAAGAAQGVRKDVTILNLFLINGLTDYRDKIFKELGVSKWE